MRYTCGDFSHGRQLFSGQKLVAAPLQSRACVAEVRHQAAEVVAHNPHFVYLGGHFVGTVLAAVELCIGDQAVEWEQNAIKEEPQQESAQKERQPAGNAHDPGREPHAVCGMT